MASNTTGILILGGALAAGVAAWLLSRSQTADDAAAGASGGAVDAGSAPYVDASLIYQGRGDAQGGGVGALEQGGATQTFGGTTTTRAAGREVDPYAGLDFTRTSPTDGDGGGDGDASTGGPDGGFLPPYFGYKPGLDAYDLLDGAFALGAAGATAAGIRKLVVGDQARGGARSRAEADAGESRAERRQRRISEAESARVAGDGSSSSSSRRVAMDAPGPFRTGPFDVADAPTSFRAGPEAGRPRSGGGARAVGGPLAILGAVGAANAIYDDVQAGASFGTAVRRQLGVSDERAAEIERDRGYLGAGGVRAARYGYAIGEGAVQDAAAAVRNPVGTAERFSDFAVVRPGSKLPNLPRENPFGGLSVQPSSTPGTTASTVRLAPDVTGGRFTPLPPTRAAPAAPSVAAAAASRAASAGPAGPPAPAARATPSQRAVLRGDPAPSSPAPAPARSSVSGVEARALRAERIAGGM